MESQSRYGIMDELTEKKIKAQTELSALEGDKSRKEAETTGKINALQKQMTEKTVMMSLRQAITSLLLLPTVLLLSVSIFLVFLTLCLLSLVRVLLGSSKVSGVAFAKRKTKTSSKSGT